MAKKKDNKQSIYRGMGRGSNPASRKALKPFTKDDPRINRKGYPKGIKDKKSAIRSIIETNIETPEDLKKWLGKWKAHLPSSIRVEDMMVWMQVKKAISEQDTAAFKILMEMVYGKPKQGMELSGKDGKPIEHTIAVLSDLSEEELDEIIDAEYEVKDSDPN